ncbi:tyrosine decarboxylase MfnA [Candidatus Bathyarchaeota archaeon]|nr:tyrosine decarboxylase MfnA [Candidatus Bathyarchaeota archaeon]
MQPKGTHARDVIAELKSRNEQNKRYTSGRILCSMCTSPHSVAKKAYQQFFESNLGDQALFPAAAEIEREVIAQLSDLLHGKDAAGFVVSGGTEANLLALLAAKNKTNLAQPEVILPDSAHFSFTKTCNLIGLKPVYASLDGNYRVNPSIVEKLISKNTVAIVGTAGTAELGAVDPIDDLSKIALRYNVHLHVDAAFGGLIIPFIEKAFAFDFNLEGVESMTVDPHKMGMAAIPAGGILFRRKEMLGYLKTETPYLSDNCHYTFVGTRSGASAASAWAVFKTLGVEGYTRIVSKCIKNAHVLARGLEKIGYTLLCEPQLNIVAFKAKNTKQLSETLWRKGWYVSYIPRYDCIRVVVMPHVKRRHISAFLADLAT